MHSQQNNVEEAARIAFLLRSYILDQLTPADKEELDNWVNESEANKDFFLKSTDRKELLANLDIINTRFHLEKNLQELKSGLHFEKENPGKTILAYWKWAIAASIVLALGITGIYITRKTGTYITQQIGNFRNIPSETVTSGIFPGESLAKLKVNDMSIYLGKTSNGLISSQETYTITADNGHIKYSALATSNAKIIPAPNLVSTRGGYYSFELTDGTKVWLNSSSSIKFSPIYSGNERRVEIIGEVYFEVASAKIKGPNYGKPFIVDIKDRDVSIEVLGTSFNVKAYPEETIKTTLFDGAVKISTAGKTSFLKPNDQAEVLGDNIQTTNEMASLLDVKSWKDGFFRFSNANAKTILTEIGRWYGVEIIYEGPIDDNMGYTLILSRDIPVSSILDVIRESGGITFEIKDRKIFVIPTDPIRN
jgi:transmembrane sensor